MARSVESAVAVGMSSSCRLVVTERQAAPRAFASAIWKGDRSCSAGALGEEREADSPLAQDGIGRCWT